ncbi:uncharacterized protein LOC125756216 [Rhipicephalus sanguineus]|uniref:uncharacterized protein LOC125756216 n=1 Tax=Rhipicephalus sanguineus TaxID=34632 RepID=UPI0020C2C129|nr:uncharacterized protein LOC125756216 [Rhipicephalus sanguineus]
MPSTFPGMIVSLLAYCKEIVQDAAMVVESYTVIESTCKIGCRFYKLERVSRGSHHAYEKRWSYLQAHALDYTICGNDTSKVCIQGLCQKKPNEPPTATTKKSQPVTATPSTKVTAIPTAVPTSPCICDCSSAAPTRPQMHWNTRHGKWPYNRVSRP